MRILLIEDDKQLNNAVNVSLTEDGYNVTSCFDGDEAYDYAVNYSYDVLILDRMLPGIDGITLLKKLRTHGFQTPVILITALTSLEDKVTGLDAGADDYLPKPFSTIELKARLRALLRRPNNMENEHCITFADIKLDWLSCMISCQDTSLQLSKKECQLLEYLLRNPFQTLTRDQLLLRVWGETAEVEEGSLDTYIYFLRRHLKMTDTIVSIKTIHGVGYQITTSATI